MNLLIEKAPDYIVVGGKKAKIDTSFGVWVEFFIACNSKDDNRILAAVKKVFPGGIPSFDAEEIISACLKWLFPPQNDNKTGNVSKQKNTSQAFDFEIDGNVIYCELWEYFPHLMKRGITFHEGMELIRLLMHNDKTMLWHRAFARCGDFSKMDKEQKSYWTRQRAIWTIPETDKNIDDIFSAAF